jgi:hypothetical protein
MEALSAFVPADFLGTPVWLWLAFLAIVLARLAFDLGVKMLVFADSKPDIARKPLLRFMRSHMRVTDAHHGNRFFVRLPDPATGRAVRHATPLFLALVRMFIGAKIFLVNIVGKFPPALSLAVTIGLIAGGVLWSLWKTRGPSGGRPATAER